VDKYLGEESLRAEAEISAVDLASNLLKKHPERAAAVAGKLTGSKDKGIADRAKQILQECEKLLKK
jgi:hypothetical protein